MPKKIQKDIIHAKGVDIGIYTEDYQNEYLSLTDIARYKSDDPTAVIQNWMRGRDVIEFLGLWESLHNPDFNPIEFEGFREPLINHRYFITIDKSVRESSLSRAFSGFGFPVIRS